MVCLNPIRLKTNSSVVGSVFSQKLYNYVPCGHCASCQQTNSRQWLFRASWQFAEVVRNNGFVLFDTLTYAPEHLPHLSDFLGDLKEECKNFESSLDNDDTFLDFPCFSLPHVQTFLNRLRISFRRKYDIPKGEPLPLKYFLCSEYGTSEKCTHRPHYHIVLYVLTNDVKPLELSRMVSDCWEYGRTDGIRYKGKNYVLQKRVINSHTKNGDSVHLHEYVTKYVEKDSDFSKVVKNRLYAFLFKIYRDSCNETYLGGDAENWLFINEMPLRQSPLYVKDKDFIEWLSIPSVHSLFLKTKHLLEQFHKQSQGFGEYLLECIDLPYLWKTGCQLYRTCDKHSTIINIPLPMYYYRKLFQEQVYLGDKLIWQHTEIGKRFADVRKFQHVEFLAHDIKNKFVQFNVASLVDFKKLAEYAIFRENSIGYIAATSSVDDKLKFPHWFLSKRRGKTYISEFYHSDNEEFVDFSIDFDDFVRLNMISDPYFDSLLDRYRSILCDLSQGKQERFEMSQRHKRQIHQLQLF